MTLITFERSSGLIGNEIHLKLDLNDLPDGEAQTLQKLLLAADFFRIPQNLSAQSTPDEFQYVITVQAGHSEHTFRASDTTLPKALAPLVNELTALRVATS
jgi:hypothetical protein